MQDLPGSGLEPVPPELAGGFLTTALPGKSRETTFNFISIIYKYDAWGILLNLSGPQFPHLQNKGTA